MVLLAAIISCGAGAAGAEVRDLYYAQIVVTGTKEPERSRGFKTGLADVVVKLTGDFRLTETESLTPFLEKAATTFAGRRWPRLPDDGTGALPLLRHVILNDDKSSTYKLALLRVLCRIADGAAGFARGHCEDFVAVPVGLVALTWIRLYKPLLKAGLPQSPSNVGEDRLCPSRL